jgi:hypothetical protein
MAVDLLSVTKNEEAAPAVLQGTYPERSFKADHGTCAIDRRLSGGWGRRMS